MSQLHGPKQTQTADWTSMFDGGLISILYTHSYVSGHIYPPAKVTSMWKAVLIVLPDKLHSVTSALFFFYNISFSNCNVPQLAFYILGFPFVNILIQYSISQRVKDTIHTWVHSCDILELTHAGRFWNWSTFADKFWPAPWLWKCSNQCFTLHKINDHRIKQMGADVCQQLEHI